jgi:hypothetical protein
MRWIVVSRVDNQLEPASASAVRVGLVRPQFIPLPEGHPPVEGAKPHGDRKFRHRPDCKGMMKTKTVELSNKLRAALGLPMIAPTPHALHSAHHTHQLGPNRVWHHGPPHERHHHKVHRQDMPFVERLTHALNNLGKWEGRAVAFVLGKFFVSL